MKRVANILFLVGGILSIVLAATWVCLAAMFYVFASEPFKELIIKGIEEGTINSDFPGDPTQVATAIQIMFLSFGISFTVMTVFSAINAVFAFKGRNTNSKGMFICNIVFGVLSGVEVNLVASIFALIKGDTVE